MNNLELIDQLVSVVLDDDGKDAVGAKLSETCIPVIRDDPSIYREAYILMTNYSAAMHLIELIARIKNDATYKYNLSERIGFILPCIGICLEQVDLKINRLQLELDPDTVSRLQQLKTLAETNLPITPFLRIVK